MTSVTAEALPAKSVKKRSGVDACDANGSEPWENKKKRLYKKGCAYISSFFPLKPVWDYH